MIGLKSSTPTPTEIPDEIDRRSRDRAAVTDSMNGPFLYDPAGIARAGVFVTSTAMVGADRARYVRPETRRRRRSSPQVATPRSPVRGLGPAYRSSHRGIRPLRDVEVPEEEEHPTRCPIVW